MHEQRQTAFTSHASILVIQPKLISNFARAAANCFAKANTVTVDLFQQHWDSAHNMSRGIALNPEDTGHGPYRRINPISSKPAVASPAQRATTNRGQGHTHRRKLRETARTQGVSRPARAFHAATCWWRQRGQPTLAT